MILLDPIAIFDRYFVKFYALIGNFIKKVTFADLRFIGK
jgi:hypothetical protein